MYELGAVLDPEDETIVGVLVIAVVVEFVRYNVILLVAFEDAVVLPVATLVCVV